MKYLKSILWGSGLGITTIFIPFFFLTSGFENASNSEILFSFLSSVLTGIIGVLIATIILPPKFSFKTIAISIIALPTGSFVYVMIVIANFLVIYLYNPDIQTVFQMKKAVPRREEGV